MLASIRGFIRKATPKNVVPGCHSGRLIGEGEWRLRLFPAIHASKWCHNSHTAFAVERTKLPNKSLWVTFTVIYLWFEEKKKFFPNPLSLKIKSEKCHSSSAQKSRSQSFFFPTPSRHWIINQSKQQWRPEFFNQHIHINRDQGSNERGFSAVSSSNANSRRLTRRETSGIILWESDMKFYYKNPLRCMMITWKALMRKIHLFWRIATGGSKWRKAGGERQPTHANGRQ